jgi:hypothetical protein
MCSQDKRETVSSMLPAEVTQTQSTANGRRVNPQTLESEPPLLPVPDKTYLVRFKQADLHSHLVICVNDEIHGDHLVFLRSDRRLAALFLLEIVESWSEVDF